MASDVPLRNASHSSHSSRQLAYLTLELVFPDKPDKLKRVETERSMTHNTNIDAQIDENTHALKGQALEQLMD
jgi:hypothetical protein